MAEVNCCSGQGGGNLTPGENFYWVNNQTTSDVTVSGCSAWCTASSYDVPKQVGSTPGKTAAQVKSPLSAGEYSYSQSGCITPTQPHVTVKGK